MRRLILLRHGKTEQTSVSGGDFERALTGRGLNDAAEIGRRLDENGFTPDLALVSTARRAMQTWEAASPAFPSARMSPVSALYHAAPETLADVIASIGEGPRTVMLVGHNPGLHEFSLELLAHQRGPAPTPLNVGFPTAAAVVFAGGDVSQLVFERFLSPREPTA